MPCARLLLLIQYRYLFERSEFLIATSKYIQKKNLCAGSTNLGLSGEKKLSVCSTNLGFSGGSANRYCRTLGQYDTRYVLCTRYVCTWYQPAEIYTSTYVRNVFVFVSPFCFSTAPFVYSLVGGGTHDTYVPPVDAHV